MMATKLFAFVATVFLASSAAGEDICSEFQDNCSPTKHLCKITCNEGLDPCTTTPNSGACPDLVATPIIFADMNGEKCKETCKADSAECAFFRHDFVESSKTKICYLMDKDQCDRAGDGCNEGDECMSGAVNCDGGGHVVDPEVYTCPSGTTHHPQTIPNFNLHWNCQDVNNNYADHNIEEDTPDAPGKTICTAKPDCVKNDVIQNYVYECVSADDSQDETKGKWQWVDDGSTDPEWVVTVTDNDPDNIGKLKEAFCNADPLQLSNYEEQINHGMEILCVGEPIDDDNKVPAQNSCILICDGYPILNFYTRMAKWIYTMMDEPNNEIDIPSDPTGVIFCHT